MKNSQLERVIIESSSLMIGVFVTLGIFLSGQAYQTDVSLLLRWLVSSIPFALSSIIAFTILRKPKIKSITFLKNLVALFIGGLSYLVISAVVGCLYYIEIQDIMSYFFFIALLTLMFYLVIKYLE